MTTHITTSERETAAAEPGGDAAPGPLTAGTVDVARRTYARYAEAAETGLNAFETTAVRAAADLRAVAGATQATMLQVFESGADAARGTRDQVWEQAERRYTRAERLGLRNWAGLREITRHMLVAADANLKAGFDCAERLAAVSDASAFVALQTAFLQEQSRRTAQHVIDMHRMTAEFVRRSVSAQLGEAP